MIKPKYNFIDFLLSNFLYSIFINLCIVILEFIQRMISGNLSTFLINLKNNYLFFFIIPIVFIIYTIYQVNIKLEINYDDDQITIIKKRKEITIKANNIIAIDLDNFGYRIIGFTILRISYKCQSKFKRVSCLININDALDIYNKFKKSN